MFFIVFCTFCFYSLVFILAFGLIFYSIFVLTKSRNCEFTTGGFGMFSHTGVRLVWCGRSPCALRARVRPALSPPVAPPARAPSQLPASGNWSLSIVQGGTPSLSLRVLRPQRQGPRGPLCPPSLCGLQSCVRSSSWLAATPWRLSPSHSRQPQARAPVPTLRCGSCVQRALLGGRVVAPAVGVPAGPGDTGLWRPWSLLPSESRLAVHRSTFTPELSRSVTSALRVV